jgi:hypothetical protein
MTSVWTATTTCLLGVAILCGSAIADQIYLDAHFNDKEIDEPIGMGGAEVGEPIDVPETITATVRDGPMGSPSLEIQDRHLWAGHATFELLDSAELTEGMVSVAADLWFDSIADGDSCTFMVCEQGSNQRRFAELVFRSDGSILLDYGESASYGHIGDFSAGRPFRVIIEFNMDVGTFDVWLDGVRVVEALSHGIADRGIGRVRVGCLFDADQDGRFSVDALSVTDYFQAVGTEESNWGRVKTAFR